MRRRNADDGKETTFSLRLAINAVLLLLALKTALFAASDSPLRIAYLVSFFQDALLIVASYIALVALVAKVRALHGVAQAAFGVSIAAVVVVSVAHSFLVFEWLRYPASLFGIELGTVRFFFEHLASPGMVMAAAGALLTLSGVSWVFPRYLAWPRLLTGAAIALTLLAMPTLFRPAVNPLVYAIQDQVILSWSARSDLVRLRRTPLDTRPATAPASSSDHPIVDRSHERIALPLPRYRRVLVLVMEGIDHERFVKASQADAHSFINQQRQHIVSHDNYYATNLDSFTSLVALVSGVFVPYRAYVDVARYRSVSARSGLLAALGTSGFSTHFLTSYGAQQRRFIPALQQWSEVRHLDGIDDIDDNGRYTCVTRNKVERACEDLAVLDDLVAILKDNRQPFVLQEMVYGHTSAWQDRTGIEAVDYYNLYFNRVVAALQDERLLDDTLLVVVADHGPRHDALRRESYHVPLLFWARDLKPRSDHALASHVDFQRLLAARLQGIPFVSRRTQLYTVGHSGELVYGTIDSDGGYLFINDRMLNARGNLSTSATRAFNAAFQQYRDDFDRLAAQGPQTARRRRTGWITARNGNTAPTP